MVTHIRPQLQAGAALLDSISETDLDRIIGRIAERIAPEPIGTRSITQWEQRKHLDLPGADDPELAADDDAIRLRQALEGDRCPAWFAERRYAIALERRQRREAARSQVRVITMPDSASRQAAR